MSFLYRTKKFIEVRPKEAKWTAIGGLSGIPVGLTIGGVGVAALGGAVGIPAVLLCTAVGAAIGNRIGVEKDRPLSAIREEETK